jgi:predicted ATPase
MITKLKLSNFKSHSDTELKTGALTVLTGMNSSGKSSVLQALLLLRQSYKKGRLNSGLDLNKPLYDIGKASDALSRFAKNDVISFIIEAEDKYEWNFCVDDKKLHDTFIPSTHSSIPESSLLKLSLFTDNFQYLSASRWANRSLFPKDNYAVETEKQISLEYGQGELVAHFLWNYGKYKDIIIVPKDILHPNSLSNKLLDQVIAWECEISPRVTVTVEERETNVIIEYGYEKTENNVLVKGLRAENVGFGISYSLPVIVALLSASPDAFLIIENPEAHLHPRGQSKLAELIALAAQAGIQIIIETHSDHVFNGVCKAISQKKIDKEKVKVHYFELDDENVSVNTEIQFSDSGRVLNYKKGLFDQFDEDLNVLLGL